MGCRAAGWRGLGDWRGRRGVEEAAGRATQGAARRAGGEREPSRGVPAAAPPSGSPPPARAARPCSEPFKKPRGWLMWGLLGAALSPAVVYLSALAVDGLGASDAAGRGTVDAVSSIITMDFSTYASLMATTALLAPLLEETVRAAGQRQGARRGGAGWTASWRRRWLAGWFGGWTPWARAWL